MYAIHNKHEHEYTNNGVKVDLEVVKDVIRELVDDISDLFTIALFFKFMITVSEYFAKEVASEFNHSILNQDEKTSNRPHYE